MDFLFFDQADKIDLLRIFAKLFRIVELCLALVFLSWSFSRLPFAVRISGQYFGKLSAFIATPLFGFILCNAIIIALVVKPSRFSSLSVSVRDGGETDELYEELVKSASDSSDSLSELDLSTSREEIVYQDKQIIAEVINTIAKSDMDSDSVLSNSKVLMRTLSEKLKRDCAKTPSEKLRRSETENCRNLELSGDIFYYPDDLSSEEFQKKIEAFIAKEKKFRREESSAIVLHCES